MVIGEKELLQLIKHDECEWIEYKTNNGEKIGEYISALANAAVLSNQEEAYLIFGVDDTKKIVGTSFKFGNSKEMKIRALLNPKADFVVDEVYIDGLRVLIFVIKPAKIYPIKYKDSAYIRINSSLTKLSTYPDKERLLWDQLNKYEFETELALKCEEVGDIIELLDCHAFFELLKMPYPNNIDDVTNRLKEYKMINEKRGNLYITNMGAILLAKNINVFDNVKRKAVRLIIYDGDNNIASTRLDIYGIKGYAAGFKGLIDFIESQLPKNEVISSTFREEKNMYPSRALREFIANSLIHQDFSIRGTSPMIEIYKNRIEITNPGKPLIAVDRFIDHAPVSRNEKLASMMHQFYICEERGSGVDRAIDACEEYQLPAPNIQKEDDYTRVTLYALRPLKSMTAKDKVRAVYQHCVLQYIMKDYMTNESLRERLGIKKENYSIASRFIKLAIDAEKIKPLEANSKANRYQKYIPYWV